jgi:16S rRNA pseudouridine516 synthase
MQIARLLHAQGFGSRRECEGLCASGRVMVGGQVLDNPFAEVEPEGLVFTVDGAEWPWCQHALLMLHKPAGVECSRSPKAHAGVLTLLPAPLRRRGVQPVGRLDADTTGLLLLTDDGPLIHRLTSPRHHVPKVYEVTVKHPVEPPLLAALAQGVVLDDDPAIVCAQDVQATGTHTLRMTLTEGKYHQVKRMVAAGGNRVEALHRSAFGSLTLPADLLPGRWRWVDSSIIGA